MSRGEVEKQCFDYVKSELFSNQGICYVCSIEDEELMGRVFQTALPNSELSKFPDFVFDDGFIEHFEVTSSHFNRHGSTMRIEQNNLRKEADEQEKALENEMNETPCNDGKTIITDKWHSKHSYDSFCSSFKQNWENHIDSLEKYIGKKNIGIFMIQYNDSALIMDALYPDIKNELLYGDLLERPKYRGYRLTHDSTMLEYVFQYKDKIKYIVFFNNDKFKGQRCEIICVENIPEILKIIRGKYSYHCATVGSAHIISGISLPNPLSKEDDNNE